MIRVDAVWLASEPLGLQRGKFVWSSARQPNAGLCRAPLDALVLGLSWQRVGEAGVITVI